MIPAFCTEVFPEATTATISIETSGGTPFTFSWSVPSGLYWLGDLAYPAAPNLLKAFEAELNTQDPDGVGWSVFSYSPDPNLGCGCAIQCGSGVTTFTATNAAATHLLWSLGFRLGVVSFPGLGADEANSDGVPFATWWPNAFNTLTDRFTPVASQVATSALPGSGTLVGYVRQDDRTQGRWWRTWRVVPVAAARCSYRRAVSQQTPQWATIAGLSTNPGDSALDNPDWWFARTLSGYTFAAIEDQSALPSGSVRFGLYRFVDDPSSPMSFDSWRALRTVTQFGPAGSTQSVEFSAVLIDEGNL